MGDAIGQVLPFAVGVALSPIPIIAVELMLGTPRARVNGPAFVLGWIVGLTVAGTLVLLLSSSAGASDDGGPARWVSWLKIALGVLMLYLALKQWRSRPRGDQEPELPKWMETVDAFKPPKAAAFGVVLSAVNPKNLVLILGAAAAIAQTGASGADQAVALAVFVVLGTLGPGIPVAIYLVGGERATKVLEDIKAWMRRENAVIMAVLCLVIGAKLIGDGISGL